MTHASDHAISNPYVGPRTFTEKEGRFFFGREREARDLTARIVSERLLLFYAQSGAGKSSLLNARVIPKLRDGERFQVLPVGRVSGELPAGVAQVDNIYAFNLMTSLDQSDASPARLVQVTLSDFLARLAVGELNLDLKLRRHLESLNKSASEPATASPSISELLQLSTLKEKERLQEEARQAVVAHQNKMEKIAREEDAHWKSVYFNLERRTGKSYDLATATLKNLQDLAKFRNQLSAFNDKMKNIRKNYGGSRVLIQRFERNGLL